MRTRCRERVFDPSPDRIADPARVDLVVTCSSGIVASYVVERDTARRVQQGAIISEAEATAQRALDRLIAVVVDDAEREAGASGRAVEIGFDSDDRSGSEPAEDRNARQFVEVTQCEHPLRPPSGFPEFAAILAPVTAEESATLDLPNSYPTWPPMYKPVHVNRGGGATGTKRLAGRSAANAVVETRARVSEIVDLMFNFGSPDRF